MCLQHYLNKNNLNKENKNRNKNKKDFKNIVNN